MDQNIFKGLEDLKKTVTKFWFKVYTDNSTTAEYTLILRICETLRKLNMLGHKASLSTCLRIGIIAATFSDHCIVQLEINYQQTASKPPYF